MTKHEFVDWVLAGAASSPRESAEAFAPANIALCKYWGKRNDELNLPVTSSLSVSLGRLGTTTRLSLRENPDEILLGGRPLAPDTPFARRLRAFLDLFRTSEGPFFRVQTVNTVPTGAGLASSASGFAALTLALNQLMQWGLEPRALSMLARLGSGSAARSLYPGFVLWNAGHRDDGLDSYAEPLEVDWPEFRIATVTLSAREKPLGSRPAMHRTRETSILYQRWPAQVERDLFLIREALTERDFESLGTAAEANALAMHATMIASWPPVLYWLPETVEVLHRIWSARGDGLPVYLTMDAGPNVKLLFTGEHEAAVRRLVPDLEVITPFGAPASG